MEQINTILMDMPGTIRAYTLACVDGSYTIVLNSRLCYEALQRAYIHEMAHIRLGDYELRSDVGILEYQRHRDR